MLHVFTGTDDGAVAEAALKHFNKIKPEDGDDFANDIIDGNADNAEHAYEISSSTIQALQTLPFFGGKKVVWLKRATFMGSDRTGEAERAKAGVEALLETLKQGLTDDIDFVLSTTGIDKRRAFYKWLKDNAKIIEHNKLDTSQDGWEEQVAHMVTKRASELNLEFDPEALELFVMLAGEDTRQIKVEIEKLDLYLGKDRRKVELEDIRAMVPLSRAGVVFEIGRALQKRDGVRALELIDQQLSRNESAIGILRASIIPTVRNLFMARAVMENVNAPVHNYRSFESALNNLPELEKAWLPQKKAGGVNVYPLFLSARDAKAFPLAALKKAMESCLDADRSLVTTGLDHRMILHRLVVELISSAKRRK
ncbi:DNA polymerase III, delta subunit [Rubritalea squalenifaciens DSM 18772]|uniref:DNA polymerase III, delta subunit n=1 Tax=Rubritalea squalenifaciens DSM 18772 TaxID=1123071 RepID=A0A1M6P7C4_9BACT|nr:DNA polymerase III subunit delta [Rubritalea squalenifaciens]SHK03832.1 DNA polymerase III, delta subunit [Rubritalea squalenifaciens DSM 18772]